MFWPQTLSRINTPTFLTPVILHTSPPMKMEDMECYETSAYKIQTPGNYAEESIQKSKNIFAKTCDSENWAVCKLRQDSTRLCHAIIYTRKC
jgi:hypothetical protein